VSYHDRDWRDRHTHTLQVKRTSFSYDAGRKFGAWVTTSCGKHLTDRSDTNFGYKYVDSTATDAYNKKHHGKRPWKLIYLPRDVWLISGWDKLDIKAVTKNPTCAACRKTTKPIRKTATSKNSDVAVRTRARIAGR
jgi:hypothetical protein